jgi:Nucleotide-diphospho-sugar transferase
MTDSSRELAVLVVSDPEFLPRLKTLAASIERNMPSAILHAWLVNVDGNEAAELRAIHPRTECTFVREALDDTVMQMGMDGITTFTEKAGFCVNLRANAIQTLLVAGVPRVLFMDADCIVRRDLAGLIRMMDENDILIHERPGAPDYMRVCAAVIAVRRTARSIRFVERLVARIAEIGNRLFFADQLAFHLTTVESGAAITVTHLPSEYIDWDFDERSAIWTGKGQRKYKSDVYREEEARYSAATGRSASRADGDRR